MKKISTFIICFFLIHVVKADPANISSKLNRSNSVNLATQQNIIVSNHKDGDTTFVPVVADNILGSYQNMLFKHRLDSVKKEIPLDYNQYVQNYIDIYTAPQRKESIGKILGLTKYYFPIYEKAFRDAGIPEEIKYLSIVESALDPNAVSRAGATGPWQFMFATAKLYGLNMDNYVDERRDPIQASYAAAAYLKDAYQDFGDWLVAIASYNCGKGNITRAIQKAGASDFWSIRPYLPVETRNYVPAYIAIAYIMNCYKKHNIIPQICDFAIKTDTVLVNKYVSLTNISKVINVDIKQLNILNPQYMRHIINGTDAIPKRMVIPQIDKASFALLYDALNNPGITSDDFVPVKISYKDPAKKKQSASYYIVRSGETLSSIADQYGVEVQDLKVWNHLHTMKVRPGTELTLTGPSSADKYGSAKSKPARNFITYKVHRGDTLSAIADKFDGSTVEKIKSLNGLKGERLQPGMTLKISRG